MAVEILHLKSPILHKLICMQRDYRKIATLLIRQSMLDTKLTSEVIYMKVFNLISKVFSNIDSHIKIPALSKQCSLISNLLVTA